LTEKQGSFTEIQGSFTEIQGSFAEIQGSLAEIQGSFADDFVLQLELPSLFSLQAVLYTALL